MLDTGWIHPALMSCQRSFMVPSYDPRTGLDTFRSPTWTIRNVFLRSDLQIPGIENLTESWGFQCSWFLNILVSTSSAFTPELRVLVGLKSSGRLVGKILPSYHLRRPSWCWVMAKKPEKFVHPGRSIDYSILSNRIWEDVSWCVPLSCSYFVSSHVHFICLQETYPNLS